MTHMPFVMSLYEQSNRHRTLWFQLEYLWFDWSANYFLPGNSKKLKAKVYTWLLSIYDIPNKVKWTFCTDNIPGAWWQDLDTRVNTECLQGMFPSVERNQDLWNNKIHMWHRSWITNKGQGQNLAPLIAWYILSHLFNLLETICLKMAKNPKKFIQNQAIRCHAIRIFKITRSLCSLESAWNLATKTARWDKHFKKCTLRITLLDRAHYWNTVCC